MTRIIKQRSPRSPPASMGCPTVVINGEAFWGIDATDMAGG